MIGVVWIYIVSLALDEVSTCTGFQIDAPPCPVKWIELQDVFTPGAEYHVEISNVLACKEACKSTIKGCVAVERHAPQFDNCWTHSTSLDKVEKERKTWKGATQFVLVKDCPSSTLTPTAKVNEDTLRSFTKTDAANKIQSFAETTDYKPQSVTDISTPQSFTEAVEIKSQSSTKMGRSNSLSSTDVTKPPRFTGTIEGNSKSLPEPETECLSQFESWRRYKDTFAPEPKLYARVLGADDCKRACVEVIPNCVAVLYHISGYCWYHDRSTNFILYNIKAQPEYVLYVRIAGCENNNYSVQQPNSLLQLRLGLLG